MYIPLEGLEFFGLSDHSRRSGSRKRHPQRSRMSHLNTSPHSNGWCRQRSLQYSLCSHRHFLCPASQCRLRAEGKLRNIACTGKCVTGTCTLAFLIISLDEVNPLMIRIIVYYILIPHPFIIINVPDKHAVTRDECVISFLLTVFEEEKLTVFLSGQSKRYVGVTKIGNLYSAGSKRKHIHPSQCTLLIRRIVGGCEAVVIVRSLVKYAPFSRSKTSAINSVI